MSDRVLAIAVTIFSGSALFMYFDDVPPNRSFLVGVLAGQVLAGVIQRVRT